MTRIPIIDALRGLAAFSVAWFHLTNGYAETSWARKSGSYGWLGVEVFFVLSGFIIPYALARTYTQYSLADLPNFLLRRMIRLEPPYLLSIILVISLWHVSAAMAGFQGGQPSYVLAQLVSHLLYLIPLTDYRWLQPIYWTLAYEFAFYMIIGILYPYLFDKPSNVRFILASLTTVAMAVLGIIPPISLLFVMGLAVFYYFERNSTSFGPATAVSVALLVSIGMLILEQLVTLTAGVLAALAIVMGRRVSMRQVWSRPLLGLGAISYSLYLIHIPVGGRIVNLGRRFELSAWHELGLSMLALAVCIGFAIAFCRLIEEPSMRLARKFTPGSERPSRPADVSVPGGP